MTAPIRVLNYFGSKTRSARLYPPPRHATLIEPFAGGASYALAHPDRRVVLIDSNPDVADAWGWFCGASPAAVMALPLLRPGEPVPARLSRGARLLIAWATMVSGARPQFQLAPCATRVPSSFWGAARRARLAALQPAVAHWLVICGDYRSIANTKATWFVDAPYHGDLGRHYGPAGLDYAELGAWCRERKGQVIVCEKPNATWLPFAPLYTAPAQPRGKVGRPQSVEAVWVGGG